MNGGLVAGLRRIDFSRLDCLAVAVSGGSDSVGLLLAATELARTESSRTQIVAITVDHRLRPESSDEAAWVGDLCNQLGIRHRIASWEHDAAPSKGIPAAARNARYRLLAEQAMAAGCQAILTGHTLDDQLETVAMRSKRGSGRGEAGMAPLTLYNNSIWIARPLLETSRAKIRDFLEARNQGWIEDPSNQDQKSERVRTRTQLTRDLAARDIQIEAIKHAQKTRVETQKAAADLVRAHASKVSDGLFALDPALFAPHPAARLATRALLATIGGREYLPASEKVEKAIRRLSSDEKRLNLSGCVMERHRDSVLVWCEIRRNRMQPVPAADGAVWDRRWKVEAKTPIGERLLVGPSGNHAVSAELVDRTGIPARILKAASAAEPAIFSHDGVPASGKMAFSPVISPWLDFLPAFDLDLARSINGIVSGAAIARIPGGLDALLAN